MNANFSLLITCINLITICIHMYIYTDPMGAKISKRYSSLKSLLNLFTPFLNFLLSDPYKVMFWIFEIASFRFLANFWISPLYHMRKPKTQLSGKRATVERNRVKVGPWRWVFSVYRVLLTLQWLRSISGVIGAFQSSTSLYLENR